MTPEQTEFDRLMLDAEPIYRRGLSKNEATPGLAMAAIQVMALVKIGNQLERLVDLAERAAAQEGGEA